MFFNPTRDVLNPKLNAETLRQRLTAIDHFKYRYDPKYTYWLHYVLRNMYKDVKIHKFKYATQGVLLYMIYNQVQTYNKVDSQNFLSET